MHFFISNYDIFIRFSWDCVRNESGNSGSVLSAFRCFGGLLKSAMVPSFKAGKLNNECLLYLSQS